MVPSELTWGVEIAHYKERVPARYLQRWAKDVRESGVFGFGGTINVQYVYGWIRAFQGEYGNHHARV